MNWARIAWVIISNLPTIIRVLKEIFDMVDDPKSPVTKASVKEASRMVKKKKTLMPIVKLHDYARGTRMER